MKANHYETMPLLVLSVFIWMLGLGGCITQPAAVTLSAVGPKAPVPVNAAADSGTLKVYTATEEYGDSYYTYHPHTKYAIYKNDGTLYKSVLNHEGMDDNRAELVHLPPGQYLVWADSETQGLVKVPVIIESGKATVVNLERKPVAELDKPGIDLAYP